MKLCQAKKLIPKEIVEKYGIDFHRDGLDIHKPEDNYIGFNTYKNLSIEDSEHTFSIRNKAVEVHLWKVPTLTHVTIFK